VSDAAAGAAESGGAGAAGGRSRPSGREPVAKHGPSALRFGFGRLVLKHVPVLGESTVLDPDHVGRYRCNGTPGAREPAVDNDVVTLRQNELVFVAQGIRGAAEKGKQPLATGLDMSAMLDVAR
jgi:hypothetical protein